MAEPSWKAYRNSFIKKIRQMSGRYDLWELWRDFVTICATTLSNTFDIANHTDRLPLYERTIGKYSSAERAIFSELITDMGSSLDANPQQDFLGTIFMELGLSNRWTGQFFTPYSLCIAMADMQVDSMLEHIKKHGYVTVSDPACGAGATLIATVNQLSVRMAKEMPHMNWQNHVLFFAQDIDTIAGLMCYVQLSMLGCAGMVKIGDTLSDPLTVPEHSTNCWFMPGLFSEVWQQRFAWKKAFASLCDAEQ